MHLDVAGDQRFKPLHLSRQGIGARRDGVELENAGPVRRRLAGEPRLDIRQRQRRTRNPGSVRVHDEAGNVVTFAQRAYRYRGIVVGAGCAVRVDQQGHLLPLATVRLVEAADGTLSVTRDSDFTEMLIVHYQLVRSTDNPLSFEYTQNVTIAAGEASAPVPVAGKAGDVLTLTAGFYYTPNPSEGSDKINF